MKINLTLFFFILCTLFYSSCTEKVTYAEIKKIDKNVWNLNQTIEFTPNIKDSVQLYNIYLLIRNKEEYNYRNLWLFVDIISNNTKQSRDTIDCPLAFENGQWIGVKNGKLVDNLILYKKNYKFSSSGITIFRILQGMRDNNLKWIYEIGLKVEKVKL